MRQVFVLRDGVLVDKDQLPCVEAARAFNLPMLSPRFEAFASPVTGREINSWRGRDRDMDAAGAVDRRDLPAKPFEMRTQHNARLAQSEP